MRRFKRLLAMLKERGIKYVIIRVFFPSELPLPTMPNYTIIRKLFSGKPGIEIGGPSGLFEKKNNALPLYNIVKSLDNCNFSSSTIWEGAISAGQTFHYDENKKTGIQYIAEATQVGDVASHDYQFLISSNCLEHIANPIKALKEWLSIVKPGGLLLLVLPNKDFCFDHNRSTTSFSHLLDDYKNNTGEDDLTHLDEILKLHDLSMDLPAGTPEQFKARSLNNFENRALHHHVFDMALLVEVLHYLDMDILYTNQDSMHTIVGQKRAAGSPLLAACQSLWRKIYCGWYRMVGLY